MKKGQVEKLESTQSHPVQYNRSFGQAMTRSKTSIGPSLAEKAPRGFKKPPPPTDLSDQTKVASSTWRQLRALAMKNNYESQPWYISLGDKDAQLVELLRQAQ